MLDTRPSRHVHLPPKSYENSTWPTFHLLTSFMKPRIKARSRQHKKNINVIIKILSYISSSGLGQEHSTERIKIFACLIMGMFKYSNRTYTYTRAGVRVIASLKAEWRLFLPAAVTAVYFAHTLYLQISCYSKKTGIISLNSVNQFISVMQQLCVSFEAQIWLLNII